MALTYNQSDTLGTNAAFVGRVKVAAINYAQSIRIQTSPLPTWSQLQWSQNVQTQPDIYARQLAPATVEDPAIQGAGIDATTGDSTATDAQVQAAVQAVANRMI